MIRYLFFLIIFLIPVGVSYGETGKNFDTISNPDGTTTWTSHYDRTWDGSQWVNYLVSNNINELRFESAGIIYSFDKVACDFKLYDPLDKSLAIKSYKFGLSIDTIPQLLPICLVEGFTQTNDKVSFTINFGEFKTLFDMNPIGPMEWTHEIDNKEGKKSIFTISETCDDCIVSSIDGNKIDFGKYELDTKNEIHNTVKTTTADKGDYIIQYEKEINDKEKLIIDPTFSSNNPTVDGQITDSTDDGDCLDGNAKDTSSGNILTYHEVAAGPNDCYVGFVQWDISSIPNSAVITDSHFKFDISFILTPDPCDYMPMTVDTTTATDQQIMDDINNGTPYSNDDAICTTAGNNKDLDLGASADTDVQNALVSNRFAIGIRISTVGNPGADRQVIHESEEDGTATPKPTLEITYTSNVNAVTDLTSTDIRPNGVSLDWTTPSGDAPDGYQINFTTPWSSNVASISNNDTGSITTSATVSGLTGSTQYSFRIGTRSGEFVNGSGNVLNITTDFDPTGSFTPGTFTTNFTGTDIRTFKFERDPINDSDVWLNVTYPNTYNTTCSFYYKFAQQNDTYSNLSDVAVNADEDEASFRLNDVENEIIDVLCIDENSDDIGRYLLSQVTTFPFLEQIENFRNGTFGTHGMFGSLDFITMIAVIASMIGFNRVNESVGIIFGLFMIGALAVLSNGEIISWASTFTVGFAVLVMWAITTTRKD